MKKKYILFDFLILIVFLFSLCSCSENKKYRDDPVKQKYIEWIHDFSKAKPEIMEAVENRNWRMRSHAALAMGMSGDKTYIPVLLNLIENEQHIAVRNSAVVSLGNLKANEAVPFLLAHLKPDKKPAGHVNKRYVIRALGHIGNRKSLKPLFNILLSENKSMRKYATAALIEIGSSESSKFILAHRRAIHKQNCERYAADILGELPVSGAEFYLIQLLNRTNTETRIAAIIALGKIKSVKAVPCLVNELSRGKRSTLKSSADALVKINHAGSVRKLIRLMAHKNRNVRMSVAYVLSSMKYDFIPQTVYKVMKVNSAANEPAAYILGRKKYTISAPLLLRRLRDERQSGQDEMARALGFMEDREAIPTLILVAKRTNCNGSRGAIWSLGKMKVQESVPVLLGLLKRGDKRLISTIIHALGNIGDSSAVENLQDLLFETGNRYALQIGKAFAKIEGREVIEFIKDNIDSERDYLSIAAGVALKNINNKSMVPYAVSMIRKNKKKKYAVSYLRRISGEKYTSYEEWNKWAHRQR